MYRCTTAFAAVLVALAALSPVDALAQCCGAPAPTVAYSPVVYEQPATVYTGWYPGKHLGNFVRGVFGRPQVGTTYVAGYAPAAATPYTVGYAPTTSYRVAYRPTYPITYGQVNYAMPVVQTVARPVTLSPVISACGGCSTGCDACSGCGVAQAVYQSPSDCANCSSGAAYYEPARPSTQSTYGQQPTLAPTDDIPEDRSLVNKPETNVVQEPEVSIDESSDSGDTFWQAPPLYDPKDKLTSRHIAPVRTAVYSPSNRVSEASAASHRGHQVGATGWVSASR